MEDIDFMTYNEIMAITDERKRLEAQREFLELVKQFERECDTEFDWNLSVFSNYEVCGVFDEKEEEISTYLFAGDKVKYYPIIKEQKAIKQHICAYSGARIMPGSYYVTFKALLYNETTKTAYVGNVMCLEIGSNFNIPMTLQEFETLMYRLDFSYENDDEEYYNIQTNVRSYSLVKLNKK